MQVNKFSWSVVSFEVTFWSIIPTLQLIRIINFVLGGVRHSHKRLSFIWGRNKYFAMGKGGILRFTKDIMHVWRTYTKWEKNNYEISSPKLNVIVVPTHCYVIEQKYTRPDDMCRWATWIVFAKGFITLFTTTCIIFWCLQGHNNNSLVGPPKHGMQGANTWMHEKCTSPSHVMSTWMSSILFRWIELEFIVEAPITDHLRDFALDLEKCKAMQNFLV